jgi:predicted aspartyl protease
MKHAYSARYLPVAPVLEITVRAAETGKSVGPLVALVDTGTDVTTVPLNIVNTLQAPLARQALVEAHWGERLPGSLHTLDVRLDA